MDKKYTFEDSMNAMDRNEATDPCSSQWMLLWTYGAYIEEKPTIEKKKALEIFYKTIPDLCTNKCYHTFLTNFPPKVETRRKLMGWLQTAENSCRIQNGLKTRPFNYKELLRRWRYPDGYL
ncbi:hypothetical protein MACJ_003891 [Theileria orientalis]|uniref:thiol oxidase n=1 Tax=Theileria orientalis TaxID=68886 RepID=A0A976XJD9_THEOR|nr:hypothetical protein MACJ_003891 [Theileria orientalis]